MVGETLAHYEVRELLGRGGMGEVFRALDTKLQREVALKLIPADLAADPERIVRFDREARTLAALHHPNVASIFGFEEARGHRFLIMEFVEGETLAERLSTGPLSVECAIRMTMEIASGLEAAHIKGIVHRDLKPANIMITKQGQIKILDFGIATSGVTLSDPTDDADPTMTLDHLTELGTAIGTVAYMSPEQALGRRVDSRSDLFSLGALLYEMATARKAFVGPTQAAVLDALLRGEPSETSDSHPVLPEVLSGVVHRLLQRDPNLRFPSARELRAALEEITAGKISTVVVPSPSIAVLPFANLSADPENEYFADGMADEIISALSKIEVLRVASRTSSFAFKGRSEDVREIARTLNVSAILEGSVRRSGCRIRVAAQLVKAEDGFQLWSNRFDGDLEDVFAVQDEIAESIAAALRVVLSPEEKQAIHRVATANLEAYELYLRGRSLLHPFSEVRFVKAQALFRQAVELDPGFAPAWLGLAEASLWMYQWFDRSTQNLEAVVESSKHALSIAPNMAEAHAACGMAAWLQDDLAGAIDAFETAQALDATLWEAPFFLARVLMTQGEMERAIECFLRAAEVRPEDYQAYCLLVSMLDSLGRTEEARDAAQKGIGIIERHLQLHPGDSRAYYLGAGCYSKLGDREKALDWCERAQAISPGDGGVLYNVACTLIHEGLVEEALDRLETAVAKDWGNREWLEHDPDMDPVRNHPRFRALLDRIVTPAADNDDPVVERG